MVAHEIIFANVYCIHWSRGIAPKDAAALALKAADEALAFREMHRPGIPHAHIVTQHPTTTTPPTPPTPPSIAAPTPAPPPTPAQAPYVEPTHVHSSMASIAGTSLPESIGPIIDTTVVENETMAEYIARTPGAEGVIRDLRKKFGVLVQDGVQRP